MQLDPAQKSLWLSLTDFLALFITKLSMNRVQLIFVQETTRVVELTDRTNLYIPKLVPFFSDKTRVLYKIYRTRYITTVLQYLLVGENRINL